MWLQEKLMKSITSSGFYCTYTRHLRCFFETPHCSKSRTMCLCDRVHIHFPIQWFSVICLFMLGSLSCVFSVETVQVQRKSRLHFHCTTHMVPEIEHTISEWRVIASLILCQAGLFIDRKVKSTIATAADPREYLCLDNSARWVDMVNVSLCPGSVDSAYKENTSAQIEFLQ